MWFFAPARSAAIALMLAGITLVLAAYALALRIDPGVQSLIPARGPDAERLSEFGRRFGANETIVLALHGRDLFTAEGLAVMADLTARASTLPHVSRVLSPVNARDLDGDELGPYEDVPYERVASGRMTPAELGRRLAAHPIYGGLLVSSDEGGAGGGARPDAAALLIELDEAAGQPDHRAGTVGAVRELASRAPPGLEASVAGLPVEKVDVAALVGRDQSLFAPIILALLAVIMAALYRHPVGVAVPLSVVAGSLIWSLGLYSLAGRALNPVTSLLTPVVLVISIEGAVHLLNHHLAGRASGLDRRAALTRALRRSRIPCFNAALTTAIGFGSLVMMPIPAVRDFGLFTAAGAMISYLLTMVLAPLLIAWMPDFPPRVTVGFRPGRIETTLTSIAVWVCARPVVAAILSILVLGGSALGLGRIRVETDIIGSLRHSSPLYQATAFIDRHLTGVNAMEIVVEGVRSGDPVALGRVAALEDAVRVMPGVRKVTGVPDFYARANRAFHAGDDAWQKLPQGPQAADDLSDIHELLSRDASGELGHFLLEGAAGGGAAPSDVLRLQARVAAIGTGASQALFADVMAAAARAGLERVWLTGDFVALSNMSTSLVSNQVRGLVPALALILTAMAVQFRSVRLGLLCIIPNGAPVLMVYGLMGWTGIALSVPTAMIASIAIGMTVDNTIHLLARFREDVGEGGDEMKALGAMMKNSGRAVVFSTMALAAGFWVGAFSSFLPSVHFAVLTGAALLLGLIAEVVLLPLTLVLFRPLRGRPRAGRAAVLPLLLLLLPLAAPAGAAAPDTMLKDQFGKSDAPALHRGRILVLFYGQPSGLRRMKAWELKLRGQAEKTGPSFDVMRALDARGVKGRKSEAEVNQRLRQSVPQDIPILADWDGALVKRYELPDAEVSVTILDPKGVACLSVAGPVREDALRGAAELLRQVKEKGGCP